MTKNKKSNLILVLGFALLLFPVLAASQTSTAFTSSGLDEPINKGIDLAQKVGIGLMSLACIVCLIRSGFADDKMRWYYAAGGCGIVAFLIGIVPSIMDWLA